ncbi:MAG: hypothetical protein IPM55_09435 [Acidobacteria bacterium]|nr:hypothetical protein [Acidobacteriota bacterium]
MTKIDDESMELSRVTARIQATALAIVCGLIGGLGLFGMTAWLLIRGGPNVGAHLSLLGNYLIGYSVTWFGSFIGLLYGFVIGGLIGWSIGKIYNQVAHLRRQR